MLVRMLPRLSTSPVPSNAPLACSQIDCPIAMVADRHWIEHTNTLADLSVHEDMETAEVTLSA